MATSKNEGSRGEDDDEGYRLKLRARQETLRRLPRSDNMDETTVSSIDGHSVTGSRPPSGTRPADQMTLSVLAAPTTSDGMSSDMPPVNDLDRSSVKSDHSLRSSAAIPARLPTVNVHQS